MSVGTAFNPVLNGPNHGSNIRLDILRKAEKCMSPFLYGAYNPILGRMVILFSTKKLKLDLGLLVAVDRFTTGATAHNLRGLANAYVVACENGQPSRAEEYRTCLLRELGRRARTSES